jgi:hypothetical protein
MVNSNSLDFMSETIIILLKKWPFLMRSHFVPLPSFFAEKDPEAAGIILSELKFRITSNTLHDDWKGQIRRIMPALNRTLRYGNTPWNHYRAEAWLRGRGVSWVPSPRKPAKRWTGLPFGVKGYGVSCPSLDNHPPDIQDFSQIRDDDTKFNHFPQVPGEDTEGITQFWGNP